MALFIVFLAWTYYSNVASDWKKMTPSRSLPLNRWVLAFTLNMKLTYFFVRVACLFSLHELLVSIQVAT